MRFKRPQVRYSDTPPPATPYQAAAQVWDQRMFGAAELRLGADKGDVVRIERTDGVARRP